MASGLGDVGRLSSVWSVLTLRLPLRNLSFVKDRFRCVGVDLREIWLKGWVLLSEEIPRLRP